MTFPDAPFVLLTMHRRESQGHLMAQAFSAVRKLVAELPELHVVFPMHPNPVVTTLANKLLGGHDRIHLHPPFDYETLVAAMTQTALVMTDSGGLQEEAPAFGKHILVLRDKTERPEGVEAGVATLVGTDPAKILPEARKHLAPALALHRVATRIMEDYAL